MNAETILQASRDSLAGTAPFPTIVERLVAAGVEYYHVDYVRMCTTFYGGDGEAVVSPITYEEMPRVAAEFNVVELRNAIRDSQQNGQKFREFTRRAMSAGVQGYFAFLWGRRVTYWGRTGDQHTEWFPGTGPEPK
jgi:uncharacterized protein YbcV (DUF1398 family)